ncbi:SDR family NAD(P)-dependent oxidoreductase [Chloroflexota bacterium]
MAQLLEDKVAIITGGGRGIGRAYALRFVEEGAKVVIPEIILENAQKVAQEIEAKGGEALAIQTDVSDEAGTQEMAKKTVERFGKIDILVNNAALYYGLRRIPWEERTVEEWDRIFEVNVKGTWLCCKAVAPYMKEQRQGKIINIGSGTASGPPGETSLLMHYACTKGALMTLTRILARAMGEFDINVNCIAPGLTDTEATMAGRDPSRGKDVFKPLIMARCIKRMENPEDLVGTCVFLASDLSDFITGQTLPVDGGAWLR